MRATLRDYQTKCVDDVRAVYASGKRAPLLVIPTGGGKTIVFCDIGERVSKRKKRVTILVHRNKLRRQTSKKLDNLDVVHGVIAPKFTQTGDLVQVASVHTLVHRLNRYPEPDLIIIDEAHHTNAGTWRKILNCWKNARILGVTATPIRGDGTGLGIKSGGFFDVMVEGPTPKDLIEHGHLVQPIVYAPPSQIDLSGIKISMGDYDHSEVEKRVDKPTITGDVIEHYIEHCSGVPAIVFCVTVAHAEHVAAQFNAVGISAASIDGKMSTEIQDYRISSLENGKIFVLTSCDVVSEGTDIPEVGCVIDLDPTRSVGRYLQKCGRALRPYPGKRWAIILDHVGNCLRHGLPDETRKWDLNAEKIKRKKNSEQETEPSVRQCEKCYAVFEANLPMCPQCGWQYVVKINEIEQVSGKLVAMTEEDIQRKKFEQRREQAKAGSLEELLELAKKRGYKSGWAYRIFHTRQLRRSVVGVGV